MRRSKDLVELSRRDFCLFACAGLAVAGCSPSGTGAIQTGGLGAGDDDTSSPDADVGHVDGAIGPMHDAGATGVACTTTMVDVGAASTFTLNTPVYVSSIRMFIVRDAAGLYAVSSRCTHEGVVMAVSGSNYRCPRHGAMFKYDGTIVSGPVTQQLAHYAMCDVAGGHVAVETTLTVAKSQRLVS